MTRKPPSFPFDDATKNSQIHMSSKLLDERPISAEPAILASCAEG
jgi:hypothetical protein